MRFPRFIGLILFLVSSLHFPAAIAQEGSYQSELLAWRAQHVAELTKPDGWLSLAGLEWLQPGDNSFGSAADNRIRVPGAAPAHLGILHLEGNSVHLLPPKEGFPRGFLVGGQPAQPQPLRVDVDKDKLNSRMTIGTLSMYVIRREARFAMRVKDTHSAALQSFRGLHWFPPNERYRLAAKWIPSSPPKTITPSLSRGDETI